MTATFQDYLDQDYLAQDYLEQDYLGKLDSGGGDPGPDPPVETTLKLSATAISGGPANVVTIFANVYDQYGDAYNIEIDFASDNDTVATVAETANGKANVTLVGAGTAVITITAGSLSGSIDVTVVADPPPVFGGGGGLRIVRIGLKSIVIHV